MNMAYVRPGGVAQDLPQEAVAKVRALVQDLPKKLDEYEDLLSGQPIWQRRTQGIGVLDVTGCVTLGVTGPVLRSAGLGWDLRKAMPYCDYDTYDFDVPVATSADVWGRYQVRLAEMRESLKIVEQAMNRLAPGPVMVDDKKIAWPAQLAIGLDGQGTSPRVSGCRPVRCTWRSSHRAANSPSTSCRTAAPARSACTYANPSFVNLQALPAVSEGGLLADLIAAGASLDPVIGGSDR